MNLMDNEYQGRDGIMDEASNDKDQEELSRFEFVLNIITWSQYYCNLETLPLSLINHEKWL